MNPLKPTHLRRLFSLRHQFPAPAPATPILTTRHSLLQHNFFSTSPYGVWFDVTKPAVNRGIVIVPKGKAAVIERNRRYSKTVKEAGFGVYVLERVAYLYRTGEEAILLNPYVGTVGFEGGYAKIFINGAIRLKIVDPKLAFYGDLGAKPIEDVLSHAQNTVLDEVRGMKLFFRPSAKHTLQNCKDTLRRKIVKTINRRSINECGLQCVGCEIYDIHSHPYPLESQEAQAEKAQAMLAIWESFAKALSQVFEALDAYSYIQLAQISPESYQKSATWTTQAFIRVLTEFLPFVLDLVSDFEHSQDLKEDIVLASESLNHCIKAIAMNESEANLEKYFASVFKSINHLLNTITSPATEDLEPQATMEQLKNAQTRVSELFDRYGGLEGLSRFLARVYAKISLRNMYLQR